MRIKFCNNQIRNAGSERGFTLVELIMIIVVTGTLSSSLVIPFVAGIKQATVPEIYATATYLAQKKIEELRSDGYTVVSTSIGTTTTSDTKKGRVYNESILKEYVTHSSGSFSVSASSTEYIRVTVTVSNSSISNVALWTILAKDFYNPNAN